MTTVSWDEIKALASDLKRAQEVSTKQRLSERNIIDIINYLVNNKILELHFTTDGKTFLTPEELCKEIYEELEVHNNRISLTKLSSLLEIDFHTIETTVNKMLLQDANLHLVMGNLINSLYSREIALKINEILKEKGKITMAELTQQFDLPKHFLEKLISNNISTMIIEAHKEDDIIYTNNFIRRNQAIIRGYLSRSTKPVNVSHFNQKNSIPNPLLLKLILELVEAKRLHGRVDLNKQQFIPNIYLVNQKQYLQRIYEQNGIIDFETMSDVGVQHYHKYCETEFPNSIILSSCVVSQSIISQLEMAVNDVSETKTFVDCSQIVPLVTSSDDLSTLISRSLERKSDSNLVLLNSSFVVSKEFIQRCCDVFDGLIKQKSEEFVRENSKSAVIILSESTFNEGNTLDDSLAKFSKVFKTKTGGGQRGREVKNRAVKNKYLIDKRSGKKGGNDEDLKMSLNFLSEEDAVEILVAKFEDSSNELMTEIYELIEKSLNAKFKAACQSVILQTSDTAKAKADRRKLESDISLSINKIHLFEKGIAEIHNSSIAQQLTKCLLKSMCNDVVNLIFEQIAHENDIPWESKANVSNEARIKLINNIKGDLAAQMKSINKVIKDSDTLTEFHDAIDKLLLSMDVFLKKMDKKFEKRLIIEIGAQYHSIVTTKLEENADINPDELLLVTTILLFQRVTGLPIHLTGKFVPFLLQWLEEKTSAVDSVDWDSLKKYQSYVLDFIKIQQGSTEEFDQLKESNKELHKKILDIAINWKTIKI